ncbi:hypothetical protein GDO81_025660 [Engystomops pustulosus]|uniref:Uncharacterized protein n=1 Tax=Engystomops pustulosus TaxID=76066 RepID=A0AAV6ZJJ3_ENGPU|nr:hypothetical protein GDO81_025660 [Engystomops pustulosus]
MSTDAIMENMHHVNQPMEFQEENSKKDQNVMPKPLIKFFQGEPEVLGVTQLFIGMNHIFFGIILTISFHDSHYYFTDLFVHSGVLFWGGIVYVLSGSLSIAASYKPSLGKVNASLALNIISTIAVVASVFIFVAIFMSLAYGHHYYSSHCAYYEPSLECEGEFRSKVLHDGITSTLLLFTVLELCIALSTSIFGCKTVCRTSYSDVVR